MVRRRFGYVALGGSTWDDSTAREELVLQARLYGIGRADAADIAQAGPPGLVDRAGVVQESQVQIFDEG